MEIIYPAWTSVQIWFFISGQCKVSCLKCKLVQYMNFTPNMTWRHWCCQVFCLTLSFWPFLKCWYNCKKQLGHVKLYWKCSKRFQAKYIFFKASWWNLKPTATFGSTGLMAFQGWQDWLLLTFWPLAQLKWDYPKHTHSHRQHTLTRVHTLTLQLMFLN